MSLLLFSSDRFAEHNTPPGHPERPERADVFDAVAAGWRERGGAVAAPRPATRQELARVHDETYLDTIAGTRGSAVALDPDTYTSPESHEVALLGTGAAIDAARYALDGHGPAMAFVRPPGHHAERDRAMGFCLYNHAAAAAADALARGASRVAVVDIDVHHGNGTQWIFYDDPRVLYVSTHQFPFYPGTGGAGEVGHGDGAGYTLNVPLEVGATDADYWRVYDGVIGPIVEQYAPDLLIISAGFDAHERDPLAGMRVTTAGYAAVVARLHAAAQQACAGRITAVTEGGYHLEALAACLDATITELDADAAPVSFRPSGTSERARAALAMVRAAQKPYWPTI
jgi:acetoin utilization deacetylase AcuC-like enzyme